MCAMWRHQGAATKEVSNAEKNVQKKWTNWSFKECVTVWVHKSVEDQSILQANSCLCRQKKTFCVLCVHKHIVSQ